MEWMFAACPAAATGGFAEINNRNMEEGMAAQGASCVQVMTDGQMELLRRQISAYAVISERLVEMHRAVWAQQDAFSGMKLSGLYNDPLLTYGGPKISARQRWTPTHMQLQTLESIFYQGIGTPSKQRIKEIVAELSQHGQISEANVYNWFQNRRARSKRKKTAAAPSNTESESEAKSLVEKKAKTAMAAAYSNLSPSLYDHSPASNGSQGMYEAPESSKLSGGSDGMPVYGISISTPRKLPYIELLDGEAYDATA
ncbi:unnamed protein product [Musa acuminata subsp. burmannicoides]